MLQIVEGDSRRLIQRQELVALLREQVEYIEEQLEGAEALRWHWVRDGEMKRDLEFFKGVIEGAS